MLRNWIIQIAFFQEVSPLWHWLLLVCWVHFKILCLAEHKRPHFIVFCCFLILLLPNIVSSEVLFRYITCISGSLGSFLIINISSTPLAVYLALLSALLYWGLWLIYSSSFWKAFSVLLSFLSISNNNIHFIFFLKFVIYLTIFEVKLHFQCYKP